MPLLVLVGWPSSGKTKIVNEIKSHFKDKMTVKVLTDEDAISKYGGRNKFYAMASAEKELRGDLRSQVERNLNDSTFVIVDSGNYVKGFRYEIYCKAKELRSRYAILEVITDKENVFKYNQLKPESERYSDDMLNALLNRYEEPNSSHRWDKPHIPYYNTPNGPANDSYLQQINEALFTSPAMKPNISTESKPVADSDYLFKLDQKTSDIVKKILAAQAESIIDINVPTVGITFTLPRRTSLAELNKLRRQFISLTKLRPPTDDKEVQRCFISFVQSNITDDSFKAD